MIPEKTIHKYNGLLISIYSNLMLREITAIKRGAMRDLSFHEIHTIELIGDLGGATVTELARAARVTQSTMSTMVDKLVKNRTIGRTRSEDDRRIVHVRLTRRGRKAYGEHKKVHEEVTRSWLSVLSKREQQVILQVMQKIDAALRK